MHQLAGQSPNFLYTLADRLVQNSSVINQPQLRVLATLPIDHVYALLGISSDATTEAKSIQPDYTKTASEVFRHVAKYFYEHRGSEALMECGIDRSQLPDLPTWVPDWSSPENRRWGLTAFHGEPSVYSASGQAQDFDCKVNGVELYVYGAKIDELYTPGLNNDEFRNPQHSTVTWLDAFDRFVRNALGNQFDGVKNECWRVPIADQGEQNSGDAIRAPQSMQNGYNQLIELGRTVSLQEALDHEISIPADAAHYQTVMPRMKHNRVPFVTENGRLGLGPHCIQHGDVVFLLRGAQVPVILRHEYGQGGGTYRIVGEAYVLGIMDGEAVNDNATLEYSELVLT